MKVLKQLVEIGKATFKGWREDKATRLAAALAYYAVFSIGPVLLIATSVAGYFFGQKSARGDIMSTARSIVGPQVAQALQVLMNSRSAFGSSLLLTVISLVVLFAVASGLFAHLQDALNTVWEVRLDPNASIWVKVKSRLLSFLMVLACGVLLLASLILNSGLAALRAYLQDYVSAPLFWQGATYVGSVVVVMLVFAAVYKVLPDVRIRWGDVWVGALVTAVLFVAGQVALGIYLEHSSMSSAYGAAGSIVVVLVWIYFSSLIFLFGAEFTQVYAKRQGSRIRPEPYATSLTGEARSQQGMAPAKKSAPGEHETKEKRSGGSGGGSRVSRLSPWFKS